jgi:hypothetical protein
MGLEAVNGRKHGNKNMRASCLFFFAGAISCACDWLAGIMRPKESCEFVSVANFQPTNSKIIGTHYKLKHRLKEVIFTMYAMEKERPLMPFNSIVLKVRRNMIDK